MSGGAPQHISEVIELCKKQLSYHSKFYSKLPEFLYKDRLVQADMLNDVYERNSQLEGLLREIIENELNEETLKQVSSFGHQYTQPNNNNNNQHCSCPFCNRNPEEDGYWDDEEEEDE
jgi:hypothetical protein